MFIRPADYAHNFKMVNCGLCKPTKFKLLKISDGSAYTGRDVTVDSDNNIIVNTVRPMYKRFTLEASFGT